MRDSYFYKSLAAYVDKLGGYHNSHLHLDRSYTEWSELENEEKITQCNPAHQSLMQKHGLIHSLHNSHWYEQDNLEQRLQHSLTCMVKCNTRRADSVIDVTDDGLGLRALETAKMLSEKFSNEIDFKIGSYSPLGFCDQNPSSWSLIEQGAEISDFVGCLPEKDDKSNYPLNIGYEETCRRMIDLAYRHNTFLHVHTDQMNSAKDCGTETLLNVLESNNPFYNIKDEPRIWAIHMISPSAYDEVRWAELVARLLNSNVGVICCPSAALGMRQLRHEMAPTHNSIARVLELGAAGVHIRLGNDNCADMMSPSTTVDLTDEVFVLSAAIRFYDTEILARIACGYPLTNTQRDKISSHLEAQNV